MKQLFFIGLLVGCSSVQAMDIPEMITMSDEYCRLERTIEEQAKRINDASKRHSHFFVLNAMKQRKRCLDELELLHKSLDNQLVPVSEEDQLKLVDTYMNLCFRESSYRYLVTILTADEKEKYEQLLRRFDQEESVYNLEQKGRMPIPMLKKVGKEELS